MISLLCILVVVLPATVWLGVTLRRFIRDERQRTSLPPARAIAMAKETVVLSNDAYPQLNAFWGTEWIRIRHDGGAGWVCAKGENRLGLGDGSRPMAFDGVTEVHLIGPEGCVATFKDPADALEGHRLLMDARDDVLMRPWDELAERLGLEGHYGLLEGVVDDRRVRVELFDHGVSVEVGVRMPWPEGTRVTRRQALAEPMSVGNAVLDMLLGANGPVELPEELIPELLGLLYEQGGDLYTDRLVVGGPVYADQVGALVDRVLALARALDTSLS